MIFLAGYQFDWRVVTDRWHLFVEGAWVDLRVATIGFALACGLVLINALVRTYGHVIPRQAIRIVAPPLGNTFVGLLKGATIMAVIAVPDMVFLANELNVTLFTPFEVFSAVALILIVMVLFFSAVVYLLERRLRLA